MLKYADSKEQNISESKIRKILSTVPNIGDLTFSLVWTTTLERQLLTINRVHIYLGVNLPAVLNQNALTLSHFEKKGNAGDISTLARGSNPPRSHISLKDPKRARFLSASRKPIAAATAEVTLNFSKTRIPNSILVRSLTAAFRALDYFFF